MRINVTLVAVLLMSSPAVAQQFEIPATDVVSLSEATPDTNWNGEEAFFGVTPAGRAITLVRFDGNALSGLPNRKIIAAGIGVYVTSSNASLPAGKWIVAWDTGFSDWDESWTWNSWPPLNPYYGLESEEFGRIQQGTSEETLGRHTIETDQMAEMVEEWRLGQRDWKNGLVLRHEELAGHHSLIRIASNDHSEDSFRPVLIVLLESPDVAGGSGSCATAAGPAWLLLIAAAVLGLVLARYRV